MEKIDLNEIGIKEKIKTEIRRMKQFQSTLLGKTEKLETDDIDIRNYVKFILKNGEDMEKRELLGCLKSKVILNKKIVNLQ